MSHDNVYVILSVLNWINIVNPGATRGPGGGQAGFCMGEPHIKSHPSGGSRITLARIDLYSTLGRPEEPCHCPDDGHKRKLEKLFKTHIAHAEDALLNASPILV